MEMIRALASFRCRRFLLHNIIAFIIERVNSSEYASA